jgi:ribonuclease-3
LLNILKWFGKINNFLNHSELISEKIRGLEIILGYKIHEPEYYIKALTHRSYLELEPNLDKSNERLEYLGDSALGFVVAEFLFKEFLDEGEGFLTKYRSKFVDKAALANSAERLNLIKVILYNNRFISDNHEDGLKTIMADALEALIGAIFLDKGIEEAKKFIHSNIINPVYSSGEFKVDKNYKGQLLEMAHSKSLGSPVYILIKEEGPDHGKIFTVDVQISKISYGIGMGRNKKSAEQEAAKIAILKLLQE